jgi:uncharacterized protein
MTASSKTPREIWEQIAAYQQPRDIDGYVASFAADAVIEWPFTPQGFARRLEGRAAILAHVGPTWERAKKTNRQITGHDRVIIHETADPEVVIVEFDMVGRTPAGPFKQSMVYVLRVRAGQIVLLREYVDTAGLNQLFQSASPK